MREFLRNCLCFIGWHHWEWKSERNTLQDGTIVDTDYGRCTNWRCASHRWMVMNQDKRPW